MSARLVSVNVGLPRDVEWEDRTVRTAIWKQPVPGRRMVRRVNIDGDDQADRMAHGGEHRAVLVYQLESYRYWQEQLERDDFTPGQFGENLTVEGLADDEVCVGNRYRIGDALFEVTQPRVTCYRVGIRMEEPAMPSLLVAHRRPGFYMRVLEEGEVGAGDEIVKVEGGPEGLTVAEIDALLYLPGRSRRDLERALRIPALSEGWQGSFRELLAEADARDDSARTAPAWSGFRPFRVVAIRPESSSVISVGLVGTDAEPAAPPLPGQFLTLRLWPGGREEPSLLRSYSLSSPPDAAEYRVSVKREPRGAGSGYLHTALAVGDVIDVAAPRGSFVLREGSRPVVLASAGVGATPVLAMLHALAAERSTRAVWWLHGARNGSEHSFRDEVDGLLAVLPDAHRVVCYSRPHEADETGSAYDVTGRLGPSVLDAEGVPIDADYYLCGPALFLHDFAALLTGRGVPPEQVRSEIFGPAEAFAPGVVGGGGRAPHPPDGTPGSGPAVSFVRSNLTVPWDPCYRNLLELAEECDVPVSFGCRTGVCHTCERAVLSGSVDYDPAPLEPPADGTVLICCSRPSTEIALDL
jgi:ferredoxin-NADP reductase/MOSC domain-containing protein YiiM/ferredoxin